MEGTSQLFGSGLTYFCELVAIELRNMEAIRLAQQKMLESMGVLAQRQAEMVEGTLRRSFGAQTSMPASASGIPAAMIGQLTSLKTTMLESQANSNILSELAARGGGEAANILAIADDSGAGRIQGRAGTGNPRATRAGAVRQRRSRFSQRSSA